MQSTKNVSASLEDYLETIYLLHEESDDVRITDIASRLGLSKPSVNHAVTTLRDSGYLEHELYGTIRLTDRGRLLAEQVLHRHLTIKRFLTETLGIDEKIAEADACRMEHVVSPETIDKLSDFIEKMK